MKALRMMLSIFWGLCAVCYCSGVSAQEVALTHPIENECSCSNPSGNLGDYTCIDGTKYRCRNNVHDECEWEATSQKCDDALSIIGSEISYETTDSLRLFTENDTSSSAMMPDLVYNSKTTIDSRSSSCDGNACNDVQYSYHDGKNYWKNNSATRKVRIEIGNWAASETIHLNPGEEKSSFIQAFVNPYHANHE